MILFGWRGLSVTPHGEIGGSRWSMAEAHFQLTLGQCRVPETARVQGRADSFNTDDFNSSTTADPGAGTTET